MRNPNNLRIQHHGITHNTRVYVAQLFQLEQVSCMFRIFELVRSCPVDYKCCIKLV